MKLYFLLSKRNSSSHAMWKNSDDGDFSVICMIKCME